MGREDVLLLQLQQLNRLHKHFCQPHANKLNSLLMRADFSDIKTDTRALLHEISCKCNPCPTYEKAPRPFEFAQSEGNEFHHTVFFYIFYIKSRQSCMFSTMPPATKLRAGSPAWTRTQSGVWFVYSGSISTSVCMTSWRMTQGNSSSPNSFRRTLNYCTSTPNFSR